MTTIVTRAGKGSSLTWAEGDANFTNLNNDKLETNGALGTPVSGTLTNCTGLPAAGVTGTALVSADIGVTVQAYDADISTVAASQVEMETGTEVALRSMSPLRVAQAISALVPPAASGIPVGATFDYVGSTAPTGYVLLDGNTIGPVGSGATRANADTEDLFTLLYNAMADTEAAVSGGRAAPADTAAGAWGDGRKITLPDARGRVIAGKDNMGGSTASRITNAGAGIVGTTLGVSGGSQTHTLTEAQLASHTHGERASKNDGAAGDMAANYATGTGGTGKIVANLDLSAIGGAGTGATTTAQLVTDAAGSGTAHNNTQPTLVLNKIIKL